MKISKIFFGFSLLTAFGVNPSWADGLDVLKLPKGFHISIFAQGLENPRGMALSPEGVLYVCDMKPGKIFRLSGPDAQPQLVIEGLNKPHSLTFYQGKLYVGETNRISRFSDWSHHHWAEDGVKVVDLPDSGMHFTRTVAFGPDDKLYVSCGSDCNTCEESDNRRAAILRYNPDGTGFEIFANGLRNAVGLAFNPKTGDLWATCHGRDYLGDDLPPEIITIVKKGQNYGWPYSYTLHGKSIPDPDFGKKGHTQNAIPLFEYQAHCAPLGIHFYTGDQFPKRYRNGFLVAFHGSWNRTIPVGYKVVFVPLLKSGKPGKPEDFISGFLHNGERIGRPVDLLTSPDGGLYISDDHNGRIFKVTYKP